MDELLKLVLKAVRTATAFIESVNRGNQDLLAQVCYKKDSSPVTIADIGSQIIIITYLRTFSNALIIAEEDSTVLSSLLSGSFYETLKPFLPNGFNDNSISLQNLLDYRGDSNTPYFWVIDPIDGTKGFIRGGQYAIAIAYLTSSNPTALLAVVSCPKLQAYSNYSISPQNIGTMFYANAGEGSWEISISDYDALTPNDIIKSHSRPLHVKQVSTKGLTICKSFESSHTCKELVSAFIKEKIYPQSQYEFIEIDGQGKYCLVARGDAEDHAPGSLIVTEAGGRVSLLSDISKPIYFDKSAKLPFCDGIVAYASGSIFKQINP